MAFLKYLVNLFIFFPIISVLCTFQNPIISDLPNTPLNCPLTWVSFHKGNHYLKENIIGLNFNPIFLPGPPEIMAPIARSKFYNKFSLGFYSPTQQTGHFINTPAEGLWTYEILTNPNQCQYEWVPAKNKSMASFSVKISEKTEETIGRTFVSGEWHVCTIAKDGQCRFMQGNGTIFRQTCVSYFSE